jgi:ribosome maturation factor RimP
MKVDAKQTVSDLVEEVIAGEPYETADVAVSQYKQMVTVRVYLYGENGVKLDECARLSKMMGEAIDEAEPFTESYTLEVSSPGLDRPLTQARDYKYRMGETVKVEFVDKKRKRLHGEIVGASEDSVEFKVAEEVITVDLTDIKAAQIVF